MANNPSDEQRILEYISAAERLKQGDYAVHLAAQPASDPLGRLGSVLAELAHTLEARYQEIQRIDQITWHINAGLLLDEILESLYRDFHEIIPYNRIGFSLLEDDGRTIRARWAKADYPTVHLAVDYSAPLAGSSLEQILQTGRPRIINDLRDYLRRKPDSESTRLIVQEGIQSSLTCPLVANGVPIGFMFFSSLEPNTYASTHVRSYLRIAQQLSVIVEKGRLVTELAAQKADIEAKNAELTRLNELKNQFLGIAAHDLRSPISYILMASDFLRSDAPLSREEEKGIIDDLYDQSEHMLLLLNDLLDVTRIESGRLELHPQPIKLCAFLQEAVERHARMAAPKETAVLLAECPDGLVDADRDRLRQVVDNLLSNAIKFSPAGSTVRVEARQTGDMWRVSVSDQGPGIKPEERQKLFKEFARLSARPTGGEASTGLGLAITRRVVKAHGGEIDVDSVPGNGATFWFTLPAQGPLHRQGAETA